MSRMGLEVSKPVDVEVYDLLARNPTNSRIYRVQVKTAFVRSDRNGAIVVPARKGDGSPYTDDEVDYIVGVDGDKAYLIECAGLSEYWATPDNVSRKWVILE